MKSYSFAGCLFLSAEKYVISTAEFSFDVELKLITLCTRTFKLVNSRQHWVAY